MISFCKIYYNLLCTNISIISWNMLSIFYKKYNKYLYIQSETSFNTIDIYGIQSIN